ncbi:hypothetical protein HX052_01735 [Myroides marinus]|uniref:hypothetical protein n=1 Tax=Myroides marinus TaxID=703342 RepID=UPI0025763CA9|nr:hypothetical protein [Myroides marinus]MDM1388697.1 hypothetical protein [Myroides marinus]
MKRLLAIVFLLMGVSGFSQESALSATAVEKVTSLIDLFENENRDGIAKRVVYPLKRDYPLPDITTEFEFVSKFEQLFSPEFSAKISHSVIEEYTDMGWRGIMFDLGRMWINEEGNITKVYDQTEAEKKIRESLINADKKNLHKSVRKYFEPYAVIKVGDDIWRIDRKNAQVMRLTQWIGGKSMAEAPDAILEGTEDIQGTIRSRVLYFLDKRTKGTITILMDDLESNVPNQVSITIKDSAENETKLVGKSDN